MSTTRLTIGTGWCDMLAFMKNNYVRYTFIVLSALALIALTAAAVYGVIYFRERSAVQKLQNDIAEEQASLKKPSISVSDISCDIAPDAKIQQYSVDIRTLNATINSKQQQVADRIKALGGTISSAYQSKINDRDAGYSAMAAIQASMPLSQIANLISQIKSDAISPDYLENENSRITNSATIKQNCRTTLDYLKNLATAEALYLNQLSSDGDTSSSQTPIYPYPVPPPPPPSITGFYPPPPSLPTVSPISLSSSNSITQKLLEIRQNAINYKNNIDNLMGQINKAEVIITVKEIPG